MDVDFCAVTFQSIIREVTFFAILGCSILGCSILGCSILGCSILGCSILGCSVLVVPFWLFRSGCSVLVVSFWVVPFWVVPFWVVSFWVVSFWLFRSGCSVLVVPFWLFRSGFPARHAPVLLSCAFILCFDFCTLATLHFPWQVNLGCLKNGIVVFRTIFFL
jgi:hypothetical protein